MVPVIADRQHPMRHFLAEHEIAADEHDHQLPGGQRRLDVVEPERAVGNRDAVAFGAGAEIDLRQFHDHALLVAAHRLQEQRPVERNDDLRRQAVFIGRDRQAEWLAAAGPRHHEDRGRLAPKPDLGHLVGHEARLVMAHRHHQAGRPAGEVDRLLEIGHGGRYRTDAAQQLLEAQRRRPVLVIVRLAADPAITVLLIEPDRALVVLAHFQPEQHAVVFVGRLFGRCQQGAARALRRVRVSGQRIEPRDRAAGAVEHHAIAGRAPVAIPKSAYRRSRGR